MEVETCSGRVFGVKELMNGARVVFASIICVSDSSVSLVALYLRLRLQTMWQRISVRITTSATIGPVVLTRSPTARFILMESQMSYKNPNNTDLFPHIFFPHYRAPCKLIKTVEVRYYVLVIRAPPGSPPIKLLSPPTKTQLRRPYEWPRSKVGSNKIETGAEWSREWLNPERGAGHPGSN